MQASAAEAVVTVTTLIASWERRSRPHGGVYGEGQRGHEGDPDTVKGSLRYFWNRV